LRVCGLKGIGCVSTDVSTCACCDARSLPPSLALCGSGLFAPFLTPRTSPHHCNDVSRCRASWNDTGLTEEAAAAKREERRSKSGGAVKGTKGTSNYGRRVARLCFSRQKIPSPTAPYSCTTPFPRRASPPPPAESADRTRRGQHPRTTAGKSVGRQIHLRWRTPLRWPRPTSPCQTW
jgi:hypothetical protein